MALAATISLQTGQYRTLTQKRAQEPAVAPAQTNAAAAAFQKALLRQRATLDRLLDRRGLLGMRRYFSAAQDQLERALGKTVSGAHKESLSPLQAQQLLQQVRDAQRVISQRLAQSLRPVLKEAQLEGVDQTEATLAEVERKSSGVMPALLIGERAIKEQIAEGAASKLTSLNDTSWSRFGTVIAAGMSEAVAIALALEETPVEAISRLRAAADNSWWQAERIIQTEMAYAYNQAQSNAISQVAKTFVGVGKRWCELVDDATGLPLDNRVGTDSLVLHGQVVEYSGVFVMPPDPTVHPSFWNRTWDSSPNRPHDRSITMPWRQEWGVPGWRWLNNARVAVNSRT